MSSHVQLEDRIRTKTLFTCPACESWFEHMAPLVHRNLRYWIFLPTNTACLYIFHSRICPKYVFLEMLTQAGEVWEWHSTFLAVKGALLVVGLDVDLQTPGCGELLQTDATLKLQRLARSQDLTTRALTLQ